MSHLFHLAEWAGFALADYRPASLTTEGFVHLSGAQQLLATANRWFGGAGDLAVVVLDEASLGEVRWEDLYARGERFPHLYGPIPEPSVRAVIRMGRGPDGYEWPALLQGFCAPLWDGPELGPAILEPGRRFPDKKLPAACVLTYFAEVIDGLWEAPGVERFEGLGSEIGATRVCVVEQAGQRVAVCHPGVGGPLAAATMEELIALGCERFVVCGGAGSLQPQLQMGHLVVVQRALRDEGLSYHYLGAAVELVSDAHLLEVAEALLSRARVPYRVGTTWTTDALYRETPERCERRRQQGCLTVEMEAASLLAVARFRGVSLLPLLYCGDDLSRQDWDFRDWTSATSLRQKLFQLSLEIVTSSSRIDPTRPNV